LAHIFNQIIRFYNPEISTVKYIATTGESCSSINNYEMESITIGTETYMLNLNLYTTYAQFWEAVVEILNQEDGLEIELSDYCDGGVPVLILEFKTNIIGIAGETVSVVANEHYRNKAIININWTVDFPTPMPDYGCISEEQFCNMVTFLKKYCNNQTICSKCKNI
jgi:hypothetical protein